ncbi:MAG: hypothetical protein R2746_09765 [Acidimicrobiales bacterium]
MAGFVGVLAHQGGWDEALMVALPIGLFVVLLRVASARADRREQADRDDRVGGDGRSGRAGDR